MQKIVIIGPSGAGKSTLAKILSSSLGMKKYHLDRFFWQRNWERIDRETRIDILQNLVLEKQWIIEGTYLNSSDLHLRRADIIIYFDFSPVKCLWQVIKRHHKYRGCSRRDIPEGCTDKLTWLFILKILLFPFQEGIKLEMNLQRFPPEKVIRLHSAKDVKDFLTNPELYIFMHSHPPKPPTKLPTT